MALAAALFLLLCARFLPACGWLQAGAADADCSQGQELGGAELPFNGLGGPGIEGGQHAAKSELAQFGQQGMGQHGRPSVSGGKKSWLGRAKVKGCAGPFSGVVSVGNGSRSRAALRICLMRR